MVYRARSVSTTITMEMAAMQYLDDYAKKNNLSRSMAISELLRLARAYLKVLDAQECIEEPYELETPSILIERRSKSAHQAAKELETKEKQLLEKKKPQKVLKKAKTTKSEG